MHKVPRQWLINVVYTIIGEPFSAWVNVEIVSRNDKLAEKQNLLISMDPEIAKAFHASVNISSKFQSERAVEAMKIAGIVEGFFIGAFDFHGMTDIGHCLGEVNPFEEHMENAMSGFWNTRPPIADYSFSV